MLFTIVDVIPIVPSEFGKRSRQVIEDQINIKYANRVIHKVGLCICFYDLLQASDGLIDNGINSGTVHLNGEYLQDPLPLYIKRLSLILEGNN